MTTSAADPLAPPPYVSVDELPYDAILVVGFGGPEGPDEVMPFLENVLRGRNVPRERMLEVAEHYLHFGGVSPINGQARDLIAALRPALDAVGIELPIYWGNRNWRPMLGDTVSEMTARGVRRALALVLSAYSSYSGCRQYREDIARAREAAGPGAPRVDKTRVWYNHPAWIEANADRVEAAFGGVPADRRESSRLVFTAHSIPRSMADGCGYARQLAESCRLVGERLGIGDSRYDLVYQSRSGRPEDPWLGPDVVEHMGELRGRGITDVVVHPIGFLSDHMEVLYDLDEEAAQAAAEVGLKMVRSATVGTHPTFVAMLAALIAERIVDRAERPAVGLFGASHDACPAGCCPAPARRPRPG